MKHLISIENLSKARIDRIMELADGLVENDDWEDQLDGKTLINLFLEPSTRTRISFELAMKKLGGHVSNIIGKESSSMAKDEDLRDTLASLSQLGDVITVRNDSKLLEHDLEDSDVPVINAGDGDVEHPTQALIDLYTIRENFPKLNGLNVLMMGDCKNSRAAHSFVGTCLKHDMKVATFSPHDLELPMHYMGIKDSENRAKIIKAKDLDVALNAADVVWLIRFQKERVKVGHYNQHMATGEIKTTEHNYAGKCGFKEEYLSAISKTCIILHPYPRGPELPRKIDKSRNAAYYAQMENSLFVRMAILKEIFEETVEEE